MTVDLADRHGAVELPAPASPTRYAHPRRSRGGGGRCNCTPSYVPVWEVE